MLFNEHQIKIWNSMRNLIRDFREGKILYYDFVGALEGALDASEVHNRSLIEQWYDYWTPLEILRAQKGNQVNVKDADNYLCNMDSFLESVMSYNDNK